jgi:hypothetical protein
VNDTRTWQEQHRHALGWTEPLHGPLPNKAESFDPDLDGSHLLQAMQARLADLDWLDEHGKLLFAALVEVERVAQPARRAAEDWLDANGPPDAPDDEDDVRAWRDWEEDTDWRKERW